MRNAVGKIVGKSLIALSRARSDTIGVDLPRLRDPAAPAFNDLKRELDHLVMEEQQRHHHDERRMAAVD